MKKRFTVSQITTLGLMSAVLLLMAYTPLGYRLVGYLYRRNVGTTLGRIYRERSS